MKKILVILTILLFPIIVFALPKGDVNGDGKVTVSDFNLIRKHILETVLSSDSLKRADVNGDGKVSVSDFNLIRKIILGLDEQKEYSVKFIGSDIITTGYEGNEVKITGGKVNEHSSLKKYNKKLNLVQNQEYAVSFDYYTKSGTNRFDIDIYPDAIKQSYPSEKSTIQVNLDAKKTIQHYDWVFASNDSKITGSDVALRFFDDIRGDNEKDIVVNNILMSKVIEKKYTGGNTLGSLSTPKRTGYKFLGWYTSDGTKVNSNTIVNSDMTLYAKWTGTYEHVIIIGVDGLGDTFGTKGKYTNNNVNPTNFNRIFNNYAYTHKAQTENITISAQNWTSIFTGVTCETHGITNDIATNKTRTSSSGNQTVFYYTRKALPNAKLTSIVNWNPINHGIIETDLDVNKIHKGNDDAVTKEVVSYLEKNKSSIPTLMFVHLCDVDHAAHHTQGTCSTCGGYSKEYYSQAQKADTMLGKMYDKIDSLGLMNNTLFIVVADHGEARNSHGNPNTPNREAKEESVVVALRGYTVNKLSLPTSTHNRDVSAIVLYALGIDKPEHFISKVPSGLFNK